MPEDRTEYASLGEALRAHRVPLENHRLIERLTGAIGIASYYVTSGYIGAERAHGGPALHIASGYTNGFLSEAELLAAVGDYAGDHWPSGRGTAQWGVTHPRSGVGGGGGGDARHNARDYGTCPECTMLIAANGTCGC